MPDPERPASRIENLEKDLYSRKKKQLARRKRRDLRERDFGVSDEWKQIQDVETFKTRRPFFKIILIISAVFFIICIGVAAFFFLQGVDISPKNVVIEVRGPTQIGGGEKLPLQITVKNNNPVPIESVNLIVEYPDGTHSATNLDTLLPRYRESLDTIDPGKEARRTVEAVLFGEENSQKDIAISVEYRVSGSNAVFYADSTYELTLSSSPLSLVVESLEETVSGQDIEFTAKVKSNSADVMKNVMLDVEYPFGFEFESADPEPVFANKVWYLGDIPPEEEKEVVFRGKLTGQDGEERVFHFATGIQSDRDENAIGAEFVNRPVSLFIKRPFITTALALDGQTGDFVAKSGKNVRADITWVNNLATQIFDGEIEVAFSGAAIDKQAISVESGFYRSIDNKIVWTRDTYEPLGSIPAGKSGRVTFSFAPLGLSSGVPLRNPTVDLDVTIRGKRLSETNVPEEVESTISKQIKVSTDLVLTSKVLHFTGPFVNTGPLPPRAEQATTYTIVFSVLNSSNAISDGRVVMTLPPYVEWVGTVDPSYEEISFSPVGGQIIWNIGDLEPGVGMTLPPREVAFQIKLVPSISQIGQTVTLVNEQTISGFDRFTETTVENSRGVLSTHLNEPGFDPDNDVRVAP